MHQKMNEQIYLQGLRSFVFIATILTFVFLLIGMHNHMHLQCSLCVELKTAVGANVSGVLVNVFMCSKSCHIFEFLRAMLALKWIFVTVCYLMFLQCSFCYKTFATLFTNERSISSVNGSDMCLNIHQFTKTLKDGTDNDKR